MVQSVWYLNGPPSHVTLPFEYLTPLLPGIHVFSIQMVTVKSKMASETSIIFARNV